MLLILKTELPAQKIKRAWRKGKSFLTTQDEVSINKYDTLELTHMGYTHVAIRSKNIYTVIHLTDTARWVTDDNAIQNYAK